MDNRIRITIVGTGTSQGVPVMGCLCRVCLLGGEKDKRLRASVLVESSTTTVVIDCGPDFRQQMLAQNVQRVDAVLLTHEHQDHVAGLDELRSYIFKQNSAMPLLGEPSVLRRIETMLPYAFSKKPYPGSPQFQLKTIAPGALHVGDLHFEALRAMHGKLPILGFKIGRFAYLTDVNFLPDETLEKLKNLDVLILDALHQQKHHSHFNLEQALKMMKFLKPKKGYFTHISHHMGLQKEVNAQLPPHVKLAFDGLSFEF